MITVKANIAHKCGRLITFPTSLSKYEYLKASLTINCYDYYNVYISNETETALEIAYSNMIVASKNYEMDYNFNDELVYQTKVWLNDVIWDPFTFTQKQIKACNNNVFHSSYTDIDMVTILPTILNTIQSMEVCFEEVKQDASELKQTLSAEFANYKDSIEKSSQSTLEKYNIYIETKQRLVEAINVFEQNIEKTTQNIV